MMGWEVLVVAGMVCLTALMCWAFYVERKWPEIGESEELHRTSNRLYEVIYQREVLRETLEEISTFPLCNEPKCTTDTPQCAPMAAKSAVIELRREGDIN